MDTYRTFVKRFFYTVILLMLIPPAFNFAVDRYSVFSALTGSYKKHALKDSSEWVNMNNDRFIPVRYIIADDTEHKSFIAGSSRVWGMNTKKLGEKWYSLAFAGGKPSEHLHNLKAMISNGKKINNYYLAIDYSALYSTPDNSSLQTRLYPDGMYEWFMFLVDYGYKPLDQKDIDIIKGKYELKSIQTKTRGQLVWSPDKYAKLVGNEKHNSKIHSYRAYSGVRKQWGKADKVDQLIATLRDFKKTCDDAGINLVVYINPLHYKTYLATDIDVVNKFRREFATVMPFYDFMWLSEYTMDNSYWREVSHFNPQFGNVLIKSMTKNLERTEAGWLLTPENVEEFIQESTKRVGDNLEKLTKSDQMIELNRSFIKEQSYAHMSATDIETAEGLLLQNVKVKPNSMLAPKQKGAVVSFPMQAAGKSLVQGAVRASGDTEITISMTAGDDGLCSARKSLNKGINYYSFVCDVPADAKTYLKYTFHNKKYHVKLSSVDLFKMVEDRD